MKRMLLAAMTVFTVMALAGCGDGTTTVVTQTPTVITTRILSDPAFDGDIENSGAGLFTITQGMSQTVQSVFAGIDPASGAEFRAFLDFPLTGLGGVPGNAIIRSALLNIKIDRILTQTPTSLIPIRIELVSFQPPTLLASDFNRTSQPALAFTTILPLISQGDSNLDLSVDVTSLMTEAQRLGLVNFQIRIMEDLVFDSPGRIEINDTIVAADRGVLAPQLEVTYF